MTRFIIILSLLFSSVYAERTVESSLKDLVNGTDADKIDACNFLGQEKEEKKAISALIDLLKKTTNPRVATSSALALGYIKEKGASTSALKEKIISDKNSDVIYTSLLAILNISLANKTLEEDAKKARDFADTNHRSDEFVADLLDKIKTKLKGL